MSAFHMHEGVFEIGAGWVDQSMQMLTRTLPGGKQASLVVNREPREGDTLDAHIDGILKKLKAQLPRFVVKSRTAIATGGSPAILATVHWRQSGVDLCQFLAFTELDIEAPPPTHRVVTFTMTAPVSVEAPARADLVAILDSLRLRRV